MADRKITDFLTQSALKSNTLFAVVDPDEVAAADQNKKITVSAMFTTFEPTFTKNTAFNKNFGGTGAATTVARSDHNHSGVYEPVFTKNTAFNKNFAGTGSATTVAKSDHTHTLDAGNTDVQFSAEEAAGDLFYYNGSLWTNLPYASARTLYNYWTLAGSDLSYSAGKVTVGNTFILTSVAADAEFDTSQLLSLDSSGNVDKIAASGGGTTNFLRADGTWAAPPGGGGDVSVTGTPLANELTVWNDATTVKAVTGLSWDSTGRLIEIKGGQGDYKLNNDGDTGTANTIIGSVIQFWGTTESVARIAFYSGTDTVNKDDGQIRFQTAPNGTLADRMIIDSDGTITWNDGSNWQRLGIVDGGSSTQNGATYTVDCGNQQQYKETITTDNTTSTWTISNLGDAATLFILNTTASDKTLTLSATGMVFINMSNKVPTTAAASTLALTIPGGTNETHEVNLADSGFTDSGDRIIHVIQI